MQYIAVAEEKPEAYRGGWKTNRGIGTAKATETTFSPPIETEKWEDMYIQRVTHRLVFLIVHLQKLHIRIHLC